MAVRFLPSALTFFPVRRGRALYWQIPRERPLPGGPPLPSARVSPLSRPEGRPCVAVPRRGWFTLPPLRLCCYRLLSCCVVVVRHCSQCGSLAFGSVECRAMRLCGVLVEASPARPSPRLIRSGCPFCSARGGSGSHAFVDIHGDPVAPVRVYGPHLPVPHHSVSVVITV